MLQMGQVLAVDLIPKLSKVLKEELGDSALIAAQQTQSSYAERVENFIILSNFSNSIPVLRIDFASAPPAKIASAPFIPRENFLVLLWSLLYDFLSFLLALWAFCIAAT
jgi:hypothetical protein